jgi:hypothetical protein
VLAQSVDSTECAVSVVAGVDLDTRVGRSLLEAFVTDALDSAQHFTFDALGVVRATAVVRLAIVDLAARLYGLARCLLALVVGLAGARALARTSVFAKGVHAPAIAHQACVDGSALLATAEIP